jgi:cell division protein FtsB
MPSFLNSKIATVVLAAACVWLLVLAAHAGIRRIASQRELDAIRDRIEAGQRDNTRLTGELARMRRPAWLALLARTRLNYKRPGETVVFVYKSEKSGTISQPQQTQDVRSNLQKWWAWLRHK